MSETLTVVLVKLHSAAQFLCVLMRSESFTQAGHAAPLSISTVLSLSDENCNPSGCSSTSWLAPCQSSHRHFPPVSVGKNNQWGCLHWLLIRWHLNTRRFLPSPLSCLWAKAWRVGVHVSVGLCTCSFSGDATVLCVRLRPAPVAPLSVSPVLWTSAKMSETSGLLSFSEGSFCQAPGSAAQLPENRPFHVPSESFFFFLPSQERGGSAFSRFVFFSRLSSFL